MIEPQGISMGEQSKKPNVLLRGCCQGGAIYPMTGLAMGNVTA